MSCDHKFKKYLTLEKLDFEPKILIIGTFNPEIEGNTAKWFYGRFDNNFWDVLPRIYKKNSMRCSTPNDWKLFCKENQIAITDLITSIEDADLNDEIHRAKLRTYSDKSIAEGFHNHRFTDVVSLLVKNPTINQVYLTRGIGETFWKKAWRPVRNYALGNNLQLGNLITPSGYAFYQQGKYNKLNPTNPLSLEDFILMKWNEVLNQNINQ